MHRFCSPAYVLVDIGYGGLWFGVLFLGVIFLGDGVLLLVLVDLFLWSGMGKTLLPAGFEGKFHFNNCWERWTLIHNMSDIIAREFYQNDK